jgi:hypothetical protein
MNSTVEITLETRVKQGDDLLAQRLDEDIVMANIESGKYYGLTLTGRRIWELLEQPRFVGDLCSHLLSEFEVERETCEQEVLAFLHELQREGLIQVVD